MNNSNRVRKHVSSLGGSGRLPDGDAASRVLETENERSGFGETPYSYLMTRRIERAQALLRRGDSSVTEVCLAVGCTSLGSFSSRFTELVGETPSEYPSAKPRPPCWTSLLHRTARHPTGQNEIDQKWRSQAHRDSIR